MISNALSRISAFVARPELRRTEVVQQTLFVTRPAEEKDSYDRMVDPASHINILIIEDHKTTAQTLARIITHRIPSASCQLAHNLADGVRMAQNKKPDLTLLDMQMPLSAEDETIDIDATVRAIDLLPEPVIVVTSMQDPEGLLMEYCFAYGAENFFSKDHLLKIVETWDGEMKIRQIISSICSAYMRQEMPKHRERYKNGIKHLL